MREARQLLSSLATLLLLTCCTAGPEQTFTTSCGKPGAACCCQANDWQNPKCCGGGLKCTMFRGLSSSQAMQYEGNICLPDTTPSEACGSENGPCCLAQSDSGFITSTCRSGLYCVPSSSSPTGSKAQLQQLTSAGSFAAAVKDTSLVGTCKAFTAADCGKPYMPCGKDAAGVTCPKGPAACTSGYYCAAAYDAVVGERCIPVPANAGKVGGPCLPNNLPNAPIVDPRKTGKKIAPAFCPGTATCFTSLAGDATGFTHDQPDKAKSLGSRISGTICLEVPADCGSAPGKACCPSDRNAVTDKPLPGAGTSWAGSPCSNQLDKYGMYCSGSYIFLSGEPMGTCVKNPVCGGPNQPCCSYSKPDMGGKNCPFLGGPGAGYCSLLNVCKVCPKTPEIIEDLLRCF